MISHWFINSPRKHTEQFAPTLWRGDGEGPSDPGEDNGIRFSRGGGTLENDAVIYFELKVINADGNGDDDGLSFAAETGHRCTDPNDKSTCSDPDDANSNGDSYGVDDWFEAVYGTKDGYGFHPAVDEAADPNDAYDGDYEADYDDDNRVVFKDEYKFGGIPGQKDVFVELDFMKGEVRNNLPDEADHMMSEESVELVIREFIKHDIALHVDDGSEDIIANIKYMSDNKGGGQLYPHPSDGKIDSICSENRFDYCDVQGHENSPTDYFNWERYDSNLEIYGSKYIFHYVLVAHEVTLDGSSYAYGHPTSSGFIFENQKIIRNKLPDSGDDKDDAHLFVHELGHDFGLLDKPGNTKAMLDDGDAKGEYTYSDDDWNNLVL